MASLYQLAIAPRLRRELELSQAIEQEIAQTSDVGAACWLAVSSCQPNGCSLYSILGGGSKLGGQIAVRLAQRALQESFEECAAQPEMAPLELLAQVLDSTNRALMNYRSSMSGSSGVAARGIVCVRQGAELVASIWGDFACLLKRGDLLYPFTEGDASATFSADLGEEEFKLGSVFQLTLEAEDIVLLSSFSSISTVSAQAAQLLGEPEDLNRTAWKIYRCCLEGREIQTQPYLMLVGAQLPVIVLEEVV